MKRLVAIWMLSVALVHAGGLTFAELRKPLEMGPESNDAIVDFVFTNASDKPVVIRGYKPECTCMKVEVKGSKLHYAPGESGVLRANIDISAITGKVEKSAVVWVDKDTEDHPSVRLTVDLQVKEGLKLEPKALKWEVNAPVTPQVIQIEAGEGEALKLGAIKISNPLFKHELKTREDGKRYELMVTPTSTSAPALCQIQIETDSKYPRYKTLQAFAAVRRPLAKEAP